MKNDKTQELVRCLDTLRGYDLSRANEVDLRKSLSNAFTLVKEGWFFPLDKNQIWHRARVCQNGIKFEHIKDMSYPPATSSFGRCSSPGQQVLYASRNMPTAFSELGVTTGQEVQSIAVRVKPNNICMATVIGELSYVYGAGLSLLGIEKSVSAANQIIATKPDQYIRAVLLDNFLANLFRENVGKKDYKYKLGATVASLLFERGIKAVMYPSVEHFGGLNIAIPGKIFDQYFETVRVEVARIECLGYAVYSREILASSESIEKDGSINWSKVPGDWSNAAFSLKEGYRI